MSKSKSINKELSVAAIKEGTVIDHIPADASFKVAAILKLRKDPNMVSIATNLNSKSLGKKGIVKVSNKNLTEEEVNKIAVVAPNATVNIIKDYKVKEKIKVNLQKVIENVIRCSNPVCITNHESISTIFNVEKENPLQVRCHYCERVMGKEDIKLIG
ncbi:aspartate carbamoyltransferase regulatory subunit [archaeon]|jgi:aspartate carbamoyltransferase regulatory subunit|nr:aspartate carbamoyltransferase regulatory subunit [archaeon]MDP6547913.1 aspartate carbamoyltransferase regulatory subunit [Candidatus Woesearchaeota archaeon]|tara:strand:- start:131827 stop:132300 length:474 start_codon:yes stop_codon:yes gene_type:complete